MYKVAVLWLCTAGTLSPWAGLCDQCHILVYLFGSSHLLGRGGCVGAVTGVQEQGYLILNVLNLELLIEASGCFVSLAAESSDQRAAARCLVLDLLHVPETRRSITSTGSGGPGDR